MYMVETFLQEGRQVLSSPGGKYVDVSNLYRIIIQLDRRTNRNICRQIETDRDEQIDGQRYEQIQIYIQMNRPIDRHVQTDINIKHRRIFRLIDGQAAVLTDKQMDRCVDRQIDRQIDRSIGPLINVRLLVICTPGTFIGSCKKNLLLNIFL